jgi:acetyl-CoA carboxylase biotin carboxyl carrier protein
MRIEDIKELVELCSEKKIAELDVEMKGVKVRILGSHQPPAVEYVSGAPMQLPPAAITYDQTAAIGASPAAGGEATAPAADGEAATKSSAKQILSPMVGTFYTAPSPDAPPFVDTGAAINNDTVVCIIEAMKLMNEIKAEVSGKITKVLVENGQPVEFDQPLFEYE